MNNIDYSNYYKKSNGWAISPELISHIQKIIPKDSTVLELGSGYGSYILSQHAKMICIEHSERWVKSFQNLTYIYAPLVSVNEKTKWYDSVVLKSALKDIKYDLLLIDGPPSKDRANFFQNMHLFSSDVPWVFDDVNRKKVLSGAIDVAIKNGKKISPLKGNKLLDISKSKSPIRDVKRMLKRDFADKKKSHLILV